MAINIDKVYQKVLSLANKEQRGYIGAKDFNNFAELAQLDIVDQYFYDLNQIYRAQGNDNEYSNIIDLIQEKISYISKTTTISAAGEKVTDLYKLGSVYLNYPGLPVQQVSVKEYGAINALPFTKPTNKNPIYYIEDGKIYVKPVQNTDPKISYIPMPDKPKWGYVLIKNKPLYHAASSVNFSLHKTEQPDLVYRILMLAGISIKKPELSQTAIAIESIKRQQEKL